MVLLHTAANAGMGSEQLDAAHILQQTFFICVLLDIMAVSFQSLDMLMAFSMLSKILPNLMIRLQKNESIHIELFIISCVFNILTHVLIARVSNNHNLMVGGSSNCIVDRTRMYCILCLFMQLLCIVLYFTMFVLVAYCLLVL